MVHWHCHLAKALAVWCDLVFLGIFFYLVSFACHIHKKMSYFYQKIGAGSFIKPQFINLAKVAGH